MVHLKISQTYIWMYHFSIAEEAARTSEIQNRCSHLSVGAASSGWIAKTFTQLTLVVFV